MYFVIIANESETLPKLVSTVQWYNQLVLGE